MPVVEVHLFGPYNCSREALKRMRAQRSGAIVSVSSVASLLGVPGLLQAIRDLLAE